MTADAPTPPEATGLDPRETYRSRVRAFQAAHDEAARRSAGMARIRMGVFLLVVTALVVRTFGGPGLQGPLLWAAALLTALFAFLVVRHGRLKRKEERLAELVRLGREAEARLDRRWDGLPVPGLPEPDDHHPYARDLSVTGPASLAHLLSTVSTAPGRHRLAEWLLSPAAPGEVGRRQAAVRELGPRLDFRDEFAVRGRRHVDDHEAMRAFLAWAEGEPWLLDRPRIGWASWMLPALSLGLGLLHLTGPLRGPWWLLPLAAQLLVIRRFRDRVGTDLATASAGEAGIRSWSDLLELLDGERFTSPLLRELTESMGAGPAAAHHQVGRLTRIVHLADVRHSFFHPLLNPVLLWDLHVQRSLDRWRRRNGGRIRAWIRALGAVDALSALAALHHAHPDWCFPRVEVGPDRDPADRDGDEETGEDPVDGREEPEGIPILRARELGHPLLEPGRCVRNDVELGPPGTFLLVTGSNMSGKSTLLRALGANLVLAQAGGPACARALHAPPVTLWTSMRVEDSLVEGVSLFMAELQRLREVVDAARDAGREGRRPLLYLLDEILQGTNTDERRIAARTILRHLLEAEALGAVTTHDLTLTDEPDLDRRARKVHFQETVHREDGAPRLSFDYRLRPGPATSTNALALMEIVGLGRDPGAGGSRPPDTPTGR